MTRRLKALLIFLVLGFLFLFLMLEPPYATSNQPRNNTDKFPLTLSKIEYLKDDF